MSLKVPFIEEEIIDQYLYDENSERPWIVGFSGGKDSTMLLQLVWKALLKIPAGRRTAARSVCRPTRGFRPDSKFPQGAENQNANGEKARFAKRNRKSAG